MMIATIGTIYDQETHLPEHRLVRLPDGAPLDFTPGNEQGVVFCFPIWRGDSGSEWGSFSRQFHESRSLLASSVGGGLRNLR